MQEARWFYKYVQCSMSWLDTWFFLNVRGGQASIGLESKWSQIWQKPAFSGDNCWSFLHVRHSEIKTWTFLHYYVAKETEATWNGMLNGIQLIIYVRRREKRKVILALLNFFICSTLIASCNDTITYLIG